MAKSLATITTERVEQAILLIRGEKAFSMRIAPLFMALRLRP
jgi:hypothetical protein